MAAVDRYVPRGQQPGRAVVPTRLGNIGAIANLHIPTLVAIGGEDFASYPDGAGVAQMVEQQAPDVDLLFAEGARHNFAGHEDALWRMQWEPSSKKSRSQEHKWFSY